MTAPIVIVGAGPVGLATALALARVDIHSIVLEKKTALDPHSRATLIVPRSLQFFDRLGVLQPFLEQGQRNDAIRILRASDRKPLLTFNFGDLADVTPTPYAIALSQDRTERILLDAVQQTGVVDVLFDTAFERFEPLPNGVRVHAGDGRAWNAAVLVGADGAHSAVRGQLGWELEGKTYPTRAVLADIRIAEEQDTEAGWLADPRADSFTIAIRFADGVWRIIESAVGSGVRDEDLPAHARRLAEGVFGPCAWRETLWTAAYKKHERRAAHFVEERIALAGDSAHLNSPAGGQGMNAGLADADVLARELTSALFGASAIEEHLQRYQDERIRAFDEEVRGLTDGLEKMETLPAWARSVAFSAVGLARAAGIERVVAKKLSMLDG